MATNNNNAAANLNANATVNANANANANANTNATANPTNNKKESDPEPGFAMFIVIGACFALGFGLADASTAHSTAAFEHQHVPHLAPLTRAIAFMDYGIAAVAAYALLCIFLLCFPLPLLLKHGILFVHLCLSLSASVLVVAMWILTMIVGHNNKAFFIDECLARVANNETASGFWISYQDSFLKQGLVMVDSNKYCNHKWSDPLGGNIAAIIFILIGLGLYMLVAFAYWAHMHVKYTEAKSAAAKKATTRRADAAWNAAAVEL